ncbi:hypothetical protein MVEG_03609 [Podila verticillata NRRL 6337]|nr:MAG: hypothetical protein BYD32DRAFT_457401 [Podila humilis]KFH70761.1 hypothetical protein MVEG_03609 [Podila verticillata NRRL 6337]
MTCIHALARNTSRGQIHVLSQSRRITAVASVAPFYHSQQSSSFHTSGQLDRQSHHKNHYELLGLSKEATKKEIKSQFYKLSKLHHPDKNDSEASRKEFLAINEAYSVLGHDRQRRDYDLTLLDRTGSLYSSSSSSSSSRAAPNRGTLRRTPFRHSAQSAAAAAAARTHAAFRPNMMGKSVPGFDSKSHQEMHYEQEIRQEERRRQRQREDPDFKWKQRYDESDSPTGKLMRVSFVFLVIVVASSFMKVFADEKEDDSGFTGTATNNTSPTIPFVAKDRNIQDM